MQSANRIWRLTNSYVYKNFRAKIIRRRLFQSILLNNNTLIIINNTNEKNCCYFSIEYLSGNIIYSNKTLKIVLCDVTFFWQFRCDNFEISRKPHVAGCARIHENLVQFSSKQENQARITNNNNIFFLVRTISKLTLFVPLLTKYIPTIKRMAPNNKWKILTPLKFFYT